MRKSKKLLSVATLTLLLALNLTIVCNAGTLIMTNVKQEKSNWCWAACSQMVGTWKWGNKTQSDIVRYTYGSSLPNYTASSSQTAFAATYASNNNATWTVGSTLFLSEVTTQINSRNNPVIAGCLYNSGSGGHMLVVRGVSNNSLLISDPGKGSSEWVNYNTFANSYGGRYWNETVLIN